MYVQAIHVKNTWGSHCDKLIFLSSEEDPDLGAVDLNIEEGRQNLWGKVKEGFRYCYDHHFQEYDWFVKADDDTFMIIENLRDFLRSYETNEPVHFGHNFNMLGGYFSGGAGYVLSKEALRRLIDVGVRNSSLCAEGTGGDEDVNMGECMRNLNISHGDSRDHLLIKRFFPFTPAEHLFPGDIFRKIIMIIFLNTTTSTTTNDNDK